MKHFIDHFKKISNKIKNVYHIMQHTTTFEINIKSKCNYIHVGYFVAFPVVNVGNLLNYYKNKVV